jgi:hypothetical protein
VNADESTRMPVTLCWHCDRALDAATAMEDGNHVEAGAVSLCLYCGAVAYFTDELALRPPTEAELDELGQDTQFRIAYATFSWARQHVMLRDDGLMRDRSDPDR